MVLVDEAEKCLEQPSAVTASFAYSHRVDKLQKVPGVPDFVVRSFLCPHCCAAQTLRDIVLAHFLEILAARKNIVPETLTVIVFECGPISDDPCLHSLNHEVDYLAVDAVEVVPSVAFHQMIGGLYVNRGFRVH